MKKKFMVLVFFLMISVVTGCSKNENKSEKADISFADISAEYFASQDFTKNFEVKSSGVDYKEVKYLSGDGKEIKGWGGKIKVRAKGNVTNKQALKIAEASLVKYMDNGSSNVVMYECEVDDKSGKAIKDVSIGYADYDRSTTAQLKEDKKSVKSDSMDVSESVLKGIKNNDIKNTRYFFDCLEDGEYTYNDKKTGEKIDGEWYMATAVVVKQEDKEKLKDMLIKKGKDYLKDNDDNGSIYKGVVIKLVENDKVVEKVVVLKW